MENAVVQGDAREKLKELPDDSFHCIISDIPYGINYDEWDVLHTNTNSALGGTTTGQQKAGDVFKRRGKPLNGWSEEDKQIPKQYQEWCNTWVGECSRVLKDGGSCFIFCGRRYAHRCICAFEDAGFTFRDMIAWKKQNAFSRAQRISCVFERRGDDENCQKWQGWRLGNPRPIFEPILWFQKPYKVGTTITDNVLTNGIGAWNEETFKKYNVSGAVENFVEVKDEKGDHGLHPTQKPINIIKLLIELATKEGQSILDPFCGSGTTLVAAQQLGRTYYGIEASEEYVNVSKERLKRVDKEINTYYNSSTQS